MIAFKVLREYKLDVRNDSRISLGILYTCENDGNMNILLRKFVNTFCFAAKL